MIFFSLCILLLTVLSLNQLLFTFCTFLYSGNTPILHAIYDFCRNWVFYLLTKYHKQLWEAEFSGESRMWTLDNHRISHALRFLAECPNRRQNQDSLLHFVCAVVWLHWIVLLSSAVFISVIQMSGLPPKWHARCLVGIAKLRSLCLRLWIYDVMALYK